MGCSQAVYEEQWEGRTHIVGEEPAPLLLWPGLLGDLLHGDEEALLEVEQRGEVRKHSMQRVAVDDASRGELVGELLQWESGRALNGPGEWDACAGIRNWRTRWKKRGFEGKRNYLHDLEVADILSLGDEDLVDDVFALCLAGCGRDRGRRGNRVGARATCAAGRLES